MGRKKVAGRSEGCRSEDVERLIVSGKMTRKRIVGVVTLSQLWENYRRVRKEVKTAIMKKKEMRKISEQDGTSCKLFLTDLRGRKKD